MHPDVPVKSVKIMSLPSVIESSRSQLRLQSPGPDLRYLAANDSMDLPPHLFAVGQDRVIGEFAFLISRLGGIIVDARVRLMRHVKFPVGAHTPHPGFGWCFGVEHRRKTVNNRRKSKGALAVTIARLQKL